MKGLRKVCNHPQRQWAKCECSWHFAFMWRGQPYRFSLDKHLGKHIDNKSDAEDAALDIRKQIKAGKFGQPAPREDMTLRQLADAYLERYVRVKHPATERSYVYALNAICKTAIPRPTGGNAPLSNWRVTDIITDTLYRFEEIRLANGTGRVGVNRNLRQLRALFKWAIPLGYVTGTPFRLHGEPVVKLTQELPRSRRLQPGEEQQILDQCSPYLRAVVVAAIDTGMRHGEILSLQWSQVEGMQAIENAVTWAPKTTLFLPALKTKTKKDRRVPISSRLKAILEMRRFDPAGQLMPADAYVFGTEIGTRVAGFKRAWDTARLKAHGHTPTYDAGANLSPESRTALARIGLHFHDLRRECGSRWMDGGMPLATIQRYLGHANISMTSTYLAGTSASDDEAHRLYEERLAALQNLAKNVGTGGQQAPQSAMRRVKKTNKTAVGREASIM